MSMKDFFTQEEKQQGFIYTEEQLMARLKFFIGICLSLTLTGIVFVVLYSLIFVTQPLNAISPIDQKFFELIVPIATFLTGTLSGIMLAGNDKDLKAQALQAATRPTTPTPPSFSQTTTTTTMGPGPSAPMSPVSPISPMPPSPGINTSASFGIGLTPTFNAQVTLSSSGKPMPTQPPQPEI